MFNEGQSRALEHELSKEFKNMTKEQVQEFADANKVLITDNCRKSRCVDGRYEGLLEEFPMIAKPGGDAGDILIAFSALNELGVELDPEVVVASVMEEVGSEDNFQFHTDEHAEHDHAGAGMGCGHLKNAYNDSEKYGLNKEQAAFVMEKLAQLTERDKDKHQVVLKGDHKESAVLVVDSEKYGLKPLLREGDEIQEAFIYQKTLHQEQLDILAKKLQEKIAATGKVVEEQIIRQALDTSFAKQLGETLKRLAAGRPIYTVKIDESGVVEII
ncbi:MAG: hypothetical protein M3Q64_03075, partial [bacterium]|nr:hypothetical protein [bacterium]